MISITNAAKEPHITPLQDSMWHRGMAGIDSCVFNFFENFAAEVSSNNSVKIRSGIGMIQGRYFCVEPSTYDEVTIANGTQGEKRKDLIVCRWTVDEEQKVQSGDWVVIQGTPTTGTPAAPFYTDGDLDAGDLIADMPFYEVTLDGINVTGVAQKFDKQGGIGKLVSDETIQMLADKGYPISGGATLDQIVQKLAQNGIVSEYDSGDWHVVKYANGEADLFYKKSGMSFTKKASWGYSFYTDTLSVTMPVALTDVEFARGSTFGAVTYDVNLTEVTETAVKYQFTSYSHEFTTTSASVTLMFYIRGKYK